MLTERYCGIADDLFLSETEPVEELAVSCPTTALSSNANGKTEYALMMNNAKSFG